MNGGDDGTRTRDLCRDRRLVNHWRTQNQQVRRAVVGTRWLHRAGLARFCSTVCATAKRNLQRQSRILVGSFRLPHLFGVSSYGSLAILHSRPEFTSQYRFLDLDKLDIFHTALEAMHLVAKARRRDWQNGRTPSQLSMELPAPKQL
jgi:hypothetical protein